MIKELTKLIRKIYGDGEIKLHQPRITKQDIHYVNEALRSGVDCYGYHVRELERELEDYTQSKHAIATCSGTTALFTILKHFDNVDNAWVPNYTFRGTLNAAIESGYDYGYSDVSLDTFGMDSFWTNNGDVVNIPVYLFGMPYAIENKVGIVIEDACQALGTFYNGKHAGTFGEAGALSFNGNKIITTGGGGAILTDDDVLADEIREYIARDFNVRVPALNAALGLSQLQGIENIVSKKREIAHMYEEFFEDTEIRFVKEPEGCRSNYWLATIVFPNKQLRNEFSAELYVGGIETRKGFEVLNYEADTPTVYEYADRILCLPSGIPG